jgi:hypothetical protein
MSSDDRYVFIVEWYDAAASLIRNYNLTFYPKQNAIEMVPPPKSNPNIVRSQKQASIFEKNGKTRPNPNRFIPGIHYQRFFTTTQNS